MSMFTMKCDEQEMFGMLGELLGMTETIVAAVYCAIQNTGFFTRTAPMYGYLGLTSGGRLLVVQASMLKTEQIVIEAGTLVKVQVKNALFGQKNVCLEYMGERKKESLRFQIATKKIGGRLPHQPEYAERLTEWLSAQM